MKAPGRNELCPCGSGKKYKHCHGRTPELVAELAAMLEGGAKTASAGALPGLPQKKAPTVLPGRLSPPREVPPEIPRPEYAESGTPTRSPRRTHVKNADEIARMRAAGAVAREVLDIVLAAVKPGITTDALDAIAHAETIKRGAYPSPLNYHGFPRSLCTSVNEVICHGIPDDRVLKEGEIINCDVTVYYQGMHGDCSETAFVGRPDPVTRKLVEVTYDCMMLGIGAVKPGVRINAIGKAIQQHAHKHDFTVVRDFSGHGIGERFHMPPNVLHYYDRMARTRIEAGMTFTVEPMINVGRPDCRVWASDGWTAVTIDLERSAQFEHTLLVTRDGTELLTGGGTPWFKRQLEAFDAESASGQSGASSSPA
ncbi:MAG: type I methionyl aminopeptidase [Bradymonadia bacterium]